MLFRVGSLRWLVSESAIIVCAVFAPGGLIVAAQWFQYIPMLVRERSVDNIFLVASNGALTLLILAIASYQVANRTLFIRDQHWKLPLGRWRPTRGEQGQLTVDLRPGIESRTIRLVLPGESDRRVGRVETESLAMARRWQDCIHSA